jgi:hypothetical protein
MNVSLGVIQSQTSACVGESTHLSIKKPYNGWDGSLLTGKAEGDLGAVASVMVRVVVLRNNSFFGVP